MDMFDNSINKQLSYIDNNIGLGYERNDLQIQFDILKDKLKSKEKEIITHLNDKKVEYERNIRNRDEEVKKYLSKIYQENINLKQQVINLEIDIAILREENEELKKQDFAVVENFENTQSLLDKNYFNTIKNIEERHSKKEKDIEDRYAQVAKNLSREIREKNNYIKKLANENKYKYKAELDDDEFEYLTLSQVDEYFQKFEIKIRNYLTDLSNKDKYITSMELKYELSNEENKHVYKKLKEEKQKIMDTIDQIQKEDNLAHEEVVRQLKEEIAITKLSFQEKIDKSLENSEKILKKVNVEKEELKERYSLLNNHLITTDSENKMLREEMNEKTSEIRSLKNQLDQVFNDRQEYENLKSHYEEVKKSLIEEKSKVMSLELNISIIQEKLESKSHESRKIIEDYEKKKQAIIEKLNEANSDVQKKHRESIVNSDNEKMKFLAMIKIKDDDIEKCEDEIKNLNAKLREVTGERDRKVKEIIEVTEKNKTEMTEIKNNMKILAQEKEEDKRFRDKYEKLNINLSSANEKMNEELNKLKEKYIHSDAQLNSLNSEIERLKKQRDEYAAENDEITKELIFTKNTMESMRNSHSADISRLKNQNAELEKLTEKVHKVHILENANNENRRDLRDLNSKIKRVYSQFFSKLYGANKTISIFEESKMLDEMEMNFDNLINKNKDSHEKEIEKLKREIESQKEEIKHVKRKMFSTGGVGSNSGSDLMSNSSFNQLVKEKVGEASLYEAIIVHIKTLNVKYLLEIYDLNLQREQEIRTILNDKTKGKYQAQFENYKAKALEQMKSYDSLKKICEAELKVLEERSRMYIPPEEIDVILEDYKIKTQGIIDLLLNHFEQYKYEEENFIIFKLPIESYNGMLDNVSENLENLTNEVNASLQRYEKSAYKVNNAVEYLQKQTAVNYEVLEKIVNNPNSSKFI